MIQTVKFQGVYEYSGIQRCGKSTMMVKDLIRLLSFYSPDDVYANFRIFIDGVHCMETMALVAELLRIKAEKLRHKIFLFDEVGQFMIARMWKAQEQTEVVNFAWQMPKRDIILLYASNIGNSADVILRDATWVTIMPQYFKDEEDEEGSYIVSDVIWNYDCVVERGLVTPGVIHYQRLFDSDEPIE